MNTEMIALAIVLGYLLGSIPFGLLLTRLAGMGDIRAIGSGNIGATNVLRTGHKGLAAATLVLDGAKGAAAAYLATCYGNTEAGLLAGFAAVIGHDFPVWLRFRGGKGVATTLGVLLGASFFTGLAACATWLAIAALFRFSSLAALAAMALSPVFAWFIAGPPMAILALALAILGFWRHSANIRRLLAGTEPRIGGRDKKAA
jgi:glycerol-3-phosphate acyltransferase PlsY